MEFMDLVGLPEALKNIPDDISDYYQCENM